jgi:predicted  nucleic acid-binding Zn-ribbon protein
LYAQEGATPGNGNGSGNEVQRLIEISTRLAELNTTLRNELDGSRRNSEDLQLTLGKSKNELDTLRTELEQLRTASTMLLSKAEGSQTELTALREALTKAESSLTSLEQSFAAYRQTAELKIAGLEKSRRFYRTAFFTAAAFALGGITMGIIGFSQSN